MTFRIPPSSRSTRRPFVPFVRVIALAASLSHAALGQEPEPETPPPAQPTDDSTKLPEGAEKGPNPDAAGVLDEQLPMQPAAPPGAVPIRDLQGADPRNLQEWLEDEASQPPPVDEAPRPELMETSPDLTRDVAMSQAMSTGETLLGSLGGLGGALSSPFLAGSPNSPIENAGAPVLRPLRFGSLDVNTHASLGVTATHLGGVLYDDDYAVGGLFQGGVSALYGRDRLATLWFSYDLAGNYPDNPAQGRQRGSEGGTGSFDQNISLVGSFTFPELRKVKFVFGAKYASLSGIDRDTGGNSRRQIATGSFAIGYQYSEKTAFNFDVSVPIRQFSDAVSSTGIASTLSAETQVTRKTSIGLGYTFGSLQVEDGADQIYHQGLLSLKYSPTRFLLFNLSAGVDFRDRGGSFATTPIFGLSTTWDSRHGTLVTLAAERRVFNAASAIDTNFTSSTIVLSAIQRFDRGVMGKISAGFEYTEYEGFGNGANTNRTDKLTYISAGLMVPLALHWNCSLNGSAGKNESDVAEFDFVQMTFKTTVSF